MHRPVLYFSLFVAGCGGLDRQVPNAPLEVPAAPNSSTEKARDDVPSPHRLIDRPMGEPSPRVATPDSVAGVVDDVKSVFAEMPRGQHALQTDKPLYKPGETMWFRAFRAEGSKTPDQRTMAKVVLLDPSGGVVFNSFLAVRDGMFAGAVDLPNNGTGGRHVLQLLLGDVKVAERAIQVDSFETPRLIKKLDFVRQGYGGGEVARAKVLFRRTNGSPLSNQLLRVQATVDGSRLDETTVTTDASGHAVVAVQLPDELTRGEGIVTILTEDGGITESITRALPLIAKRVDLGFFPEGGDLIQGLRSRVYFRARKLTGKPADCWVGWSTIEATR